MNRMAEKKSVTFSSTPLERSRNIISTPDCVLYMENGSDLIKLAGNGRQYKRTYYLDTDNEEIRWFPTTKKKNKARIKLEEICEVRWGLITTPVFSSSSSSTVPASSSSNSSSIPINNSSGNSFQSTNSVNTQLPATMTILPSSLLERSFTIVYGTECEYVCLISDQAEEANIWVAGLTGLIGKRRSSSTTDGGSESIYGSSANSSDAFFIENQQNRDKWLHNAFVEADNENKGFLDDFDVIQLMKNLNSRVATLRIKQKLKEAEINRNTERGRLSSEEFVNLFKEISTRPEIFFLLVRYSTNSEYMSLDDFLFFLEAEQGHSNVTRSYCAELIENFEPSPEGKLNKQLGIDGLTAYLCSSECDIFDKEHLKVCQDMTQPLPHYFIAASYNTYLTEDQLKGPSSVNGFIRALKLGARFIKLDLWDGQNDEPIIYHGDTLTSKLSLRKTLEYINSYAFFISEYPLLIAIQNHCSPNQQFILVSLLKNTFGERLYVHEPVDTNDSTISEESTTPHSIWPSPEQLRHKIVLVGKKIKNLSDEGSRSSEELEYGIVSEEDEYFEQDRTNNYSHSNNNKYQKMKKNTRPKMKLIRQLSDLISFNIELFSDYHDLKRSLSTSNLSQSQSPSSFPIEINSNSNHPTIYILPEVKASRLISTSGSIYLSLDSNNSSNTNVSVSSNNAPSGSSFTNTSAWLLMGHNKDNLTVVYPNPCRVDSSNYALSQDLWGFGCQLLALNYQTGGQIMDLNVGFFQKNGRCGYVLKPEVMRNQLLMMLDFKEGMDLNGPDLLTQTLHIRVISGQQLPKPAISIPKCSVIDPYVLIQVSGRPSDCSEDRTKTVKGGSNSHNPIFDESFEFELTGAMSTGSNAPGSGGMGELVMVRFMVLDEETIGGGDGFIGQCTVPLDCMQTGYRHVKLYNAAGDLIPNAHLFVHIAITNKPGGGKKSKSGISLKYKNKKYKSQIKRVGIPAVDEHFKNLNSVLKESFELRQSLQTAISSLRESCSLPPFCNIKQCIRSIINSVNNTLVRTKSGVSIGYFPAPVSQNLDQVHHQTPSESSCNSSSSVTGSPQHSVHSVQSTSPLMMILIQQDRIPRLVFVPVDLISQIPELVRRSIKLFEELMDLCSLVQKKSVPLLEKISETRSKLSTEYSAITQELLTETIEATPLPTHNPQSNTTTTSSSSKSEQQKKKIKLAENFIWNIRLLQGQQELTKKLIEEAGQCLQNTRDVGARMGLLPVATTTQTHKPHNK